MKDRSKSESFNISSRYNKKCKLFQALLSSPEPKAKVSFSDLILSGVRLSVNLFVNFSHLHLLQKHWANFNQTWHKASLGEGDLRLFKWRVKIIPCLLAAMETLSLNCQW